MKPEHIISLISRWGGTMRFFPAGADERIGIAEEIAGFASDLEQVKWLVARLPKLYKEWPAMHEVRAVFCSKFKPRDGFEVFSMDDRFQVKGIPSENESLPQIAAPPVRYLAAPEEPMAPAVAKRMEQLMADMKARTQMPKLKAPLPSQAEIEAIKAAQERNRTQGIPTSSGTQESPLSANGGQSTEAA